jgi:hypothetical protein
MTEESRGLNRARRMALYLTVSAVFLAAGHLLVIQRSSDAAADWYKISPDAKIYLSMVEGPETKLPFARRMLVPTLASAIPVSPEQSLRILSYGSLLLFYCVSLFSLEILGFSLRTKILAIFAVFCCTGHLLLYQNPHIVDAFCHMCASIMLLALLTSNAALFGAAAVVGVLSHEMALFSAPSFLATGRWRAALTAVGLGFGVFVATYFSVAGESLYRLPTFSPAVFVEAYLAWGIAWIPMAAGLCLCRTEYFVRLGLLFLVVFASAAFVSIMAEGAVRMFTALMPVAVVLMAFYIAEIARSSRMLCAIFMLVLALNIIFALPTALNPSLAADMVELEDFYFHFKYPILSFHVTGVLVNLLIIHRLRSSLSSNIKTKISLVLDNVVLIRNKAS